VEIPNSVMTNCSARSVRSAIFAVMVSISLVVVVGRDSLCNRKVASMELHVHNMLIATKLLRSV